MIPQKLINSAKQLTYLKAKKFRLPSVFHIDFANEKGQKLAKILKADQKIVLLGTTLMDCLIGKARQENKLEKHAQVSAQEAKKLLAKFPQITKKEKENILQCILQHHGAKKFYSLEAEICCNADCYRFASIKGIIGGAINRRPIPLDNLVKLYSNKADEKWKALSLNICKKELKPQYEAIKKFFALYHD